MENKYEIEKRFCKNFRRWVEKHYPRQEGVLAERLGVSVAQVNNIKHARRFGTESWRRWMASQLGLDYEEMIGLARPGQSLDTTVVKLIGYDEEVIEKPEDGFRVIPLHETGKLVRGLNGFSFDNKVKAENAIIVSHSELGERIGHELRALRVADDSMWPRAPEGSIIFLDLDDHRFVDDRIYVVCRPSAVTPMAAVRRVRKVTQGQAGQNFILVAENQKHLPEMADLEWEDLVVGRALWVWRNIEGEQPASLHYERSRRLESIEWLAGGVAHELNNVLSPILGYSEIALASLDDKEELQNILNEIVEASKRAQSLGRELLSFGRQKVQKFSVLDVNAVLANMRSTLLRPITPDNVELEIELAESLSVISGDEEQIEQVVLNLVNNAIDAMPEGGRVTISTDEIEVDTDHPALKQGIRPGRHVRVSISDTGRGMDEDTLNRIFEPFFTTKQQEGSPGVGLSSAYGIVSQHGGAILASSKPGRGAVFEVYLPAAKEASTSESAKKIGSGRQLKTKKRRGLVAESGKDKPRTILVVEDEEAVRAMCVSILQKKGYAVLVAQNSEEAISLVDKHDEAIDLLLTDIIMPNMNGRELYEKIAPRYPTMGVLYMSGYAYKVVLHHGMVEHDANFIQKPFSGTELVAKIEEILSNSDAY